MSDDDGPVTRGARLVPIAIAALAIACVATALATLWFAQPVDDDFDFALDGARGAFAFAADQYAHWSGRWAGFAVLGGTLANLDPVAAYPWLLLGTWAALYLGVAAAARSLLEAASDETVDVLGLDPGDAPRDATVRGSTVRRSAAVHAIALLGCVAVWLTDDPTPIADALYWFPGSITYAVSLGLALGAVALATRARWGTPQVVGAALCALFAPAFHEVAGVLLVLAFALLAVVGPRERRRALLGLLVTAAIGAAIVVLAPGNGERAALTFETEVSFAAGVEGAVHRVLHHGWWWVRDVAFWGAVACAFFGARHLPFITFAALSIRTGRTRTLALATLLFPAAALAIPAFVTGGWIPHRMVFVAHALFVLLALATALSFGARAGRLQPPAFARWCALALLAIGVAHESNLRRGVADLVDGRPQRFADRQAERRAAASAGGDVVLETAVDAPRLLRASVMADDPQHWANRRFADYFGARSVRVVAPDAGADSEADRPAH